MSPYFMTNVADKILVGLVILFIATNFHLLHSKFLSRVNIKELVGYKKYLFFIEQYIEKMFAWNLVLWYFLTIVPDISLAAFL